MTLEWYVSNRNDLDLIPENVRKGKNIFGVEWTFAGTFSWGTWNFVGGSAYDTMSYGIRSDGTRTIKVGNKIVFFWWVWIFRNSSSSDGVSWCASILDLSTWVISSLGKQEIILQYNNVEVTLVSSYVNGNIVTVNRNNGMSGVFKFTIDIDTNSFTLTSWNDTTGTLNNNTSESYWGSTYQSILEKYEPIVWFYCWYSVYASIT